MLRARSVPRKACQVFRRPVSLILGKLVLRVEPIEFPQVRVASHLGENRSGADRRRARVAVDDGAMRDLELNRVAPAAESHRIGEDESRRGRQARKGPDHRQARGLIDIERIHFRRRRRHHLKGERAGPNFLIELGASCGSEFLRIVHAANPLGGIEDDGGSVQGSDQRAASRFVAAGHQAPTTPMEMGLEAPRAAQLLPIALALQRSTPWPKETLRTVKVEWLPARRRRITAPSKTWILSLSPSLILTCTRTVSPGRNSGRPFLICCCSTFSRAVGMMNSPPTEIRPLEA